MKHKIKISPKTEFGRTIYTIRRRRSRLLEEVRKTENPEGYWDAFEAVTLQGIRQPVESVYDGVQFLIRYE